MLGEQVCIILYKEIIRLLVSDHVDRILQNRFDRETGKIFSVLCLEPLLNQRRFCQSQRIRFHIQIKNRFDYICFFRNKFQLAGFLCLSVHCNAFYSFGFKAGRGCTT